MTWINIKSTDPGAPQLTTVEGSMVNMLDWALPQAGWTIKYTSGRARVYETVNGRLLHVYHDISVSGGIYTATVRGCEGATSATDLIDPYPSPTLESNAQSGWQLIQGPYELWLDDDFMAIVQGNDNCMALFGNIYTDYSPTYACIITTKINTNQGSNGDSSWDKRTWSPNANPGANSALWWMRNVDGSIKSSRGQVFSGYTSGSLAGAQPARGGYQNRIYREPIALLDGGSTNTSAGALALPRRGFIPHFWSCMHNGWGGLTSNDTFEDSAYNPAAVFRKCVHLIVETTDTWSPF